MVDNERLKLKNCGTFRLKNELGIQINAFGE